MIESTSVSDSKHWGCTRYMEALTGRMPIEVVAMLDDTQACFYLVSLEEEEDSGCRLEFWTEEGETAG